MPQGHVEDKLFFYQNMTNYLHLQKMQDKLCFLGNVFGCCQDENGKFLTSVTGKKEEISLLYHYVNMEQCVNLGKGIQSSELEDLQVEDTKTPWIKVAVINVKINGKPSAITWFFCAVLSDLDENGEIEKSGFETITDTEHFEYFLDILIDIGKMMPDKKHILKQDENGIEKKQFVEAEMEITLKRLTATTEVVQLLDRDDAIEYIMSDFLKVVGDFLQVSGGQIYRPKAESEETEILAEWKNQKQQNMEDSTIHVATTTFWNQKKVVVISSNTNIASEHRAEIQRYSIRAIAVIPILINEKVSMYVCFFEKEKERIWSVEEIRYINDAVKILQSVITRRIQKNSLAGSYASLEAILDNVGCGMYVCEKETNQILFVNRYVRNVFSREIKEGVLGEIFGEQIDPQKESGSYEVHYFERSRWFDFYYTNLDWMNGKKVFLCSLYDVTDKKEYQKKIEQQAYTDYLTGLYNRMCCERDLAKMVDKAKLENTHGALLYMDLDDFKHINDGLGHQYGDILLRSIAHSVQHIAGIADSCYRMGGDEFVIVVPPDIYEDVGRIVENIQKIFSKPWFLKGADYYCTMSMGVVTFPDDGDNVKDLIRKADISMYDAKKTGKNRVAHYADSADLASGRRLDMEKNMREATIKGCEQFEVYYQPIIDVQVEGNPCTGAEALIRWNNAELGFVSPGDFVPLAEYLGLINPIGAYVLESACRDCKKWNDMGKHNYKVNVNLSVVQLLQPDIVGIIKRTVERTGMNPNNLTLEVTESLAIHDMQRMKEVLIQIKEMGARIALDDFGTGYSSLSHIREIPLDVIKVDQSFVKDLAQDSYPQAFIKMVTELANTIGVQVCVEGIETEEQYKALNGMNVKMIQGYYFDRPMKRDLFEKKYVYRQNISQKENTAGGTE